MDQHNQKTPPTAPFLGAAYYPEDWDENEQVHDIAKMQEAGIRVVRIAEFAWHKMEPREGEYDFSWLHRVIDRLNAAGISVMLGTPTACPPHWLLRLHPDMAKVEENGRSFSHGGRRHCCSNNPHYRAASARIVERMAAEFANEESVIGWQIDNEIYAHRMGCFCPHCQAAFAEYLEKKYGTVERLNEAWNLNLFSQAYDSFADVPPPRDAWHNPHLKFEWLTFQNESHVDFVHMQADILHKYVNVPIGTDIMPLGGMDYRRLNEKLDVVQFNHYHEQHNLWNTGLWFDRIRTILPHPFWNTETATCWNGSETIVQSVKPDGFCRVNSYLPLALGGEANMYWLWRTHWAGHELIHGAVLDTSGRPMHIFKEVQETAALIEKTADFLSGTHIKTPVAMHYSTANWNMWSTQQVVAGMTYDRVFDIYRAVIDRGLRPDLIDEGEDLTSYRLLLSPLMLTMESGDLPTRIENWVREGGVWIAGPLTDIRTACGTRYPNKPFGFLEELTGATWLYGIPDRIGQVKAVDANGKEFSSSLWYDIWEESEENTLVRVTTGHSTIVGHACVTCRKVGKGHVIMLGTMPGHKELMQILEYAAKLANVECPDTEGDLFVVPRAGDETEGVILVEHSGASSATYTTSDTYRDIVTDKVVTGKITLPPYGIAVLEKVQTP